MNASFSTRNTHNTLNASGSKERFVLPIWWVVFVPCKSPILSPPRDKHHFQGKDGNAEKEKKICNLNYKNIDGAVM